MVSLCRFLNNAWRHWIPQIGFVQDTEPRVSAWFNRPLSSCKRRQGEALLYLSTLPTPFLPETVSLPRLPSAGGVYSPGYAFADTTLVSRFYISLSASKNSRLLCSNLKTHPFKKGLVKLMTNLIGSVCPIFFFQVEQKGCHIHNCGGGYLIWST